MNKIKILILVFLTSVFACKSTAQTLQEQEGIVIPLVEYLDYLNEERELPNTAYFKDVDNDLNKYLGTWKGTYDGKNFELVITKRREYSGSMSMDILEMRYKITEISSGNIIVNILQEPQGSPLLPFGEYLSLDKKYYTLYYMGLESKCGQNGYMSLQVLNSTSNTMTLDYVVHGEKVSDACTTAAPQIFPFTEDLILSKQ